MTGGTWDGVVPGGRIHRPRGPRLQPDAEGGHTPPRRPNASAARVRRVAPGRRGAMRLAIAALSLAALLPVAVAGTGDAEAKPAARVHAQAGASLEGRIALLSAELQLTPEQQARVRALLLQQREQVRSVWSDTSLAPALRIGRVQGISDRTADAIRGVLDDAQRRRYIQPRQRETAVGTPGADVQSWTQGTP